MSHPDYKNVRIKNKIWDQIGNELNIKGEDLKKRWKNFRDCYAKYLRSEKSRTGQQAKTTSLYKSWSWAQHMEAFRPFLQFAQSPMSQIPGFQNHWNYLMKKKSLRRTRLL
ncbi:uncharacterized protein LOC114343275 [Diabrotica virgifera virgifera]|nr:uncharacterized protein LOC114343275 [Diabrotica virgifera virgifera]